MKDIKTIVNNLKEQTNPSSIGRLNEKTLHATIKYYLEPDSSKHEISLYGYVADIVNGNHIYEIQLRNFNVLRTKLVTFLENNEVTLVYPMAKVKYINYVNEEGLIVKRRKSPKACHPLDASIELYRIKSLLRNPRLHFKILMMEINEYRTTSNAFVTNKIDQIPLNIIEEIDLFHLTDYVNCLPPLPEQFTTKDLKQKAHISLRTAQLTANILTYLNTIIKVDTHKKLYLYQKKNP